MPNQKAKPLRKEEGIPEQVIDPQKIARLEAQQARVTAMEAANEDAMAITSGNLYFALQSPTNMICYRQGSSKRRNASAKRRKPKLRRRIPRRRRNLERKRESTRVLSYISTTLAHIAYKVVGPTVFLFFYAVLPRRVVICRLLQSALLKHYS
jgi:hypothetical protein